MNAIDVESVTKTYGKNKAVDNISFPLKKGEIFGMLGPNGAGKTTSIEWSCRMGAKREDH